ncbi:bifunctional DNA primase/polymerase [Saccharopolyspora sp. 6M]|uniref:bifunctional DNA primase/polymerase n=1 Tax=Saccharopolyspora sp. 6M TaxID=2877237 RepID=UPI001CD43F9A|nr:bifunctional DNA primase/polymerase [Saccharopolyspora sp. 6M]MCA1229941.1 bifunctional DNA primase/polymerase [Saccharopolyspora sp. 6M]
MAQLREWALLFAERGWAVFPLLVGGKRPALHGLKDCPRAGVCAGGHRTPEQRATIDPGVIERCWSRAPFNIGIATGPSGLLVVDCDQPKPGFRWPTGWNKVGVSCGEDVLGVLAADAGMSLPETYTVGSARGGTHRYFLDPQHRYRNTQSALGPLIDTRGGGGYVVAPGSITPDGAYELLDDSDPAELPGWLARALAPKPAAARSGRREIASARADRYVAGAIRSACDRLAATGTGPQNKALHEAALQLGRLVAGGAVDDATVRAALHDAMDRLPLTRPEQPWNPEQIDATIDSAFRWAQHHPRTLRGRGGEAA